jgi:hypothetical protein
MIARSYSRNGICAQYLRTIPPLDSSCTVQRTNAIWEQGKPCPQSRQGFPLPGTALGHQSELRFIEMPRKNGTLNHIVNARGLTPPHLLDSAGGPGGSNAEFRQNSVEIGAGYSELRPGTTKRSRWKKAC